MGKDDAMNDFSIQAVGNEAIIKVDLSLIGIESLNVMFERLRTEQLIRKADFKEDIVEIGEELKRDWWEKNRERYLEGAGNADRD
jgi:hypothetical protein